MKKRKRKITICLRQHGEVDPKKAEFMAQNYIL